MSSRGIAHDRIGERKRRVAPTFKLGAKKILTGKGAKRITDSLDKFFKTKTPIAKWNW